MTQSLPLPPGSTIGILGGGQLGRMLALAAGRLGFDAVVLERDADSPAGRVAVRCLVGAYDDPEALKELADLADVVTYEFENVPAETVRLLVAQGAEVAPGPRALAVAQDRVEEKTFLNANGAPTVAFGAASTPDEALAAVERIGVPCLMKTRREGYDGKGQRWVEHAVAAGEVFEALGGVPVIVEAAAEFVRELSVIAARGRDGATAVYPLAENHHEHGVLDWSVIPAAVPARVAARAAEIARGIAESLDVVATETPDSLQVEVNIVEELGSDAFVYGSLLDQTGKPSQNISSGAGDAQIIVRVDPRQVPKMGSTIHVRMRPNEEHLFRAGTGERITTV